MKEGLLSEKGKPNEKTPTDWFSKYKEFTHYGQQSGPNPVSGAGDTSLIQPAPSSSVVQSKSSGSGESVPSKKAKEEVKSKKEESSSSDSSSDDSSDDE